jgi:hypothetical protein
MSFNLDSLRDMLEAQRTVIAKLREAVAAQHTASAVLREEIARLRAKLRAAEALLRSAGRPIANPDKPSHPADPP